ncbi:hypothetical protein WMY93_023737 [Mugilogobius chulae]|uniref:Myb/SANT-like DNA-binding domain-containing protein n=1 Tax=Mugilogobius chulae TaxID=88201 RepID=A0AAW0NHG1_9GOBI
MANTYKMTERDIQQLILLRASNAAIFTGRKNSAMRGWRAIKREMGLHGLMSARQLKKKWDNLNQKYKVRNRRTRSLALVSLDGRRGQRQIRQLAKVIEPLPIDDEKLESDLPVRLPSDSEELLSALNVVEMAPIENEEDVEMIDKTGNYDEAKKLPDEIPKITNHPDNKTAANTQPPVLYATLLPDSTASVASKVPSIPSQSIVVQAKTVTPQNVQPTRVLYATLLPDSTATATIKNSLASNRNIALELSELNKKLLELKREKVALEKEQAEFDKELINFEREREMLNSLRQTLDLTKIKNEKDRALLDKNRADLEKEKAEVERDRFLLDRDRAYLERDRAIFERDKVFLDKAQEDFERQKAASRKEAVVVEEVEKNTEERMDVTEKYNDLTDKVLQILTAEADQEETRKRFATLVKKLSEKL